MTSVSAFSAQVQILYSGTSNGYDIVSSTSLDNYLLRLNPGTYTVVLRNYPNTQCFNTYGPFTIGITNTPISVSAAITSNYNTRAVTCNNSADGQVTLTPSGGTAPFSYSHDGANFQGAIFDNLSPSPTSYTFTIKDANGCTNTTSPITLPNTPDLVLGSLSSSNYNGFGVRCLGGNDGEISFSTNTTGGTGSYSYVWKNASNATVGTADKLTNAIAGGYTVTVTDANNCSKTSSSVPITPPYALVAGSALGTDPQCNGDTGQINVTGASGGTDALTYSVSPTLPTSPQPVGTPITGVPANVAYTVTVTDANGCTAVAGTVTLTNPQPVTISSYVPTSPKCFGLSDGKIKATAPANVTKFSINNGVFKDATTSVGVSTFEFTDLQAGTYPIKARDANGCESATTFAVVDPTPQITGTITQTATIICNGQSTAALSVVPSGGSGTYTSYSWSNGATTQNITNIPAGSYGVTITDSNNCTGTTSNFTVVQPTALTVVASPTQVLCKGAGNGAINLSVSGGTGTKTYAWSNGATTKNISSLSPGTYSVTVTDANGCVNNSTSVTITEPASSVSVSLQTKTNVSCFGGTNGSIVVSASGGTGTFTYSKDSTNFQASNNFTGLAPGNYTITAKDANNCTATTPAISIAQPISALAITTIVRNNPLCNGNTNGNLVVTVTGGTAPYQYSIDGTNFITTSTIPNLAAGNYVVTVKDANNCTVVSASQNLANPAVLSASVSASPQSCSALVDGRLTVSASGGTGTLQYSLDGSNFQASSIFNGLAANNYTVTVRDANSCTVTRSASITLVAPIAGAITQTAFINCFGQSTAALSLGVSGGTAPFSYSWSSGATTQNISSLPVDTYGVTITDTKGCTGTASFTITQPTQLSASTTVSNYNGFGVTCSGASTGFVNLAVLGGSSPYTYAWSNGATTKDIASLAAGTYTVTVTDAKGCTASASATLTSPAAVTVSLSSKTNVTCNGGTNGALTLVGSGGTGSLNYSIDGVAWQTSNVFSSLVQGTYTVRARDQNNCVSPAPLVVTITQPPVISINFSGYQNANCGAADGAVQANASGGTGTLTYQWRDPSNTVVGNAALLSNVLSGTYTVTVTDQSLCTQSSSASVGSNGGATFSVVSIVGVACPASLSGKAQVNITGGSGPFTVVWSNGETGTSATQLPSGNNSVSVKDAANCTVSKLFVVPSPAPISLSSVISTAPDCVGGVNGSIQVTTTGGTPPYAYQWNGSTGTNVFSGAAGTYTLQIKDSQNCSFSQTITLPDATPISITVVNQVPPSCSATSDGSIQVLAAGGNGGYSYLWNTGATSASVGGLAAGTYSVLVRDSKNCTQNKSISLVAASPVSITVSNSSDVSCFGGTNGSVTLAAIGGTGSFDYSVNGGSTWQTSNVFNNLPAGTLSIQSRDGNGCIASGTYTLAQPTQVAGTVASIGNTTCNLANGSATASATGGTAPYTYQWLNAANQIVANTSVLQSAAAGSYQVMITDSKSCTASASINIAASTDVQFTVQNITATKCSSSADGSAAIGIISGRSPYTYQWLSGETTPIATQLKAGVNSVRVTDADGCTVLQTFSVSAPSAITLQSENIFNPVCAGGTGSIQVTPAGGTQPYSFTWNGETGTSSYSNIKAGNYQLTIRDANNCLFTQSFVVVDPPPYTIDLGPDKKICTGGVLNISSPVDAISYQWSSTDGFKSTGKQATLTKSGTYTLKVTNINGCVAEDSFVLSTTNDLLKADFLMTPVAHVGDTVIAIDISWPLPERITWALPTEATVVKKTPDYASMVFNTEGNFTVKLTANLAECQSEFISQVEILKKNDGSSGGTPTTGLIKSATAFPNPTTEGKINLKVELNEAADIRVRLISLSGNYIEKDFTGEGKDVYDYEILLDGLARGVYFLVLEVKNEKRVIRIVVM
jgi:hypothetical protein